VAAVVAVALEERVARELIFRVDQVNILAEQQSPAKVILVVTGIMAQDQVFLIPDAKLQERLMLAAAAVEQDLEE
jgi:hypothetical protein